MKESSNVGNLFETREKETNEIAENCMATEISENFGKSSIICSESKNQELLFQDLNKQDSCRLSLNNTDNLNVTDYVTELLNKRNSGTE